MIFNPEIFLDRYFICVKKKSMIRRFYFLHDIHKRAEGSDRKGYRPFPSTHFNFGCFEFEKVSKVNSWKILLFNANKTCSIWDWPFWFTIHTGLVFLFKFIHPLSSRILICNRSFSIKCFLVLLKLNLLVLFIINIPLRIIHANIHFIWNSYFICEQ